MQINRGSERESEKREGQWNTRTNRTKIAPNSAKNQNGYLEGMKERTKERMKARMKASRKDERTKIKKGSERVYEWRNIWINVRRKWRRRRSH